MTQKRLQIQTFRQPTQQSKQKNILNDPQTIIQEIIPKTVHSSVHQLIKLDKLPNNNVPNNSSQTSSSNNIPRYSNSSSGNPLADLLILARQAEIAREQFKKHY